MSFFSRKGGPSSRTPVLRPSHEYLLSTNQMKCARQLLRDRRSSAPKRSRTHFCALIPRHKSGLHGFYRHSKRRLSSSACLAITSVYSAADARAHVSYVSALNLRIAGASVSSLFKPPPPPSVNASCPRDVAFAWTPGNFGTR